MTVKSFIASGARSRHQAYSDESALIPAAPEYTAGDILSGSLYRVLVLGMHDKDIDLAKLKVLPSKFALGEVPWTHILHSALKAPPKARSEQDDVMPVVPRLAAHGAVIGAPRNRWLPGKLAVAALRAEAAESDILVPLAAALSVGPEDDLAAIFLETEIKAVDGLVAGTSDVVTNPPPSFWRRSISEPATPGERLARDVRALMRVKNVLPRYQWYVLLQSVLRLGVSCYQLWLCMLHEQLWSALCEIVDRNGEVPTGAEIEQSWCSRHAGEFPLLELGENATAAVRAQISRYAVARVGINLVLNALEDCGEGVQWTRGIGTGENGQAPAEALEQLMSRVSEHRDGIAAALEANGLSGGLERAAQALADRDADFVSAEEGATKNLREFLRHTMGQASRKRGDFEAFDQGFFTRPKNNFPGADQIVYPGSTTLVALAVCTALGGEDLPASMQDLSLHLREYGIYAPLGTLTGGHIGRDLEELGLTVDTPDAGGGRLLINPFARAAGGSIA
jgi:hypothetical protein